MSRRASVNVVPKMWILGSIAALLIAAPAAAQGPDRTLSQLRGAVYRVVEGPRTTVLLASPEGIVLVDPLNVEFAEWLRGELDQRFPGRPITHVVYSRVDFDRIGGAGPFNKTAEIVAAEGLSRRLRESREVLPPRLALLDGDRSAVLESGELANLPESAVMLRRVVDHDGRLTAHAAWSGVLGPEASYSGRRTIMVSGTRIELIHEPGLGDDTTLTYFPSERVLFAPTFPALAAPITEQWGRPAAIAKWARRIASLEFDTLLTGEGEALTRAQITEFATYISTLVPAVAAGYERGQSVEELRQGASIDRFTGTPYGARRDADIAYTYQHTRRLTLDATGALLVNSLTPDEWLCESAISCQFGPENGTSVSGAIGMSMRRWRFMAEMTTGHETRATVLHAFSIQSVIHRETMVSVLAAFRTSPPGKWNVSLLGGPTFVRTRADVSSGSTLVAPTFTVEEGGRGWTFGADLTIPLGSRLRLAVPVRVTTLPHTELDAFRTTRSIRAGVGLDVALWRVTY